MGTLPGVLRNISNSRQCGDRSVMIGGLPYLGMNYQSKMWGGYMAGESRVSGEVWRNMRGRRVLAQHSIWNWEDPTF